MSRFVLSPPPAPHRCWGHPSLMPMVGWALWLALCLSMIMAPGMAHAEDADVISPGLLAKAHAKWENDCEACHIRFKKKEQDTKCVGCHSHEDVGADVKKGVGFHGKTLSAKPQMCKTCHSDHKGRDLKMVDFKPQDFKDKHNEVTDYALKGKHTTVDCEKCHVSGKKYSQAPSTCVACHKTDDDRKGHKGSLGTKCAECHSEKSWKETNFDHNKTKFPLEDKHVKVKCDACHKDTNYKETPKTCFGCHKTDDDRKGHKGQYGEKCDSCHNIKGWKPSTFDHNQDTKYVLRDKHLKVKCDACHKGPQMIYKEKLSSECISCHKKDDKHKEVLGRDCQSCHVESGWKQTKAFNHDKSSFPLNGKHAEVECKDCHIVTTPGTPPDYKKAPKECYGCHRRADDDAKGHKGTLGRQCDQCHSERAWRDTRGRFDHDRTKFALLGGHAMNRISSMTQTKMRCDSCHASNQKLRNTPLDCVSCHKGTDDQKGHKGSLGKKCETCHSSDASWKSTNFDHGRTRYPLTGAHADARVVKCDGCHVKGAAYKDAPSDCVSCHKKKDVHKVRFGTACEVCHTTRAWKLWDYNHTRQAKYRLEGGHATIKCEECHRKPAPSGKIVADTGRLCITCHAKDDKHDGAFGGQCDQCHRNSSSWREVTMSTIRPPSKSK